MKKNKQEIIKQILIKQKPQFKKSLNNNYRGLFEKDFLDSFDIINILVEIEKKTKKKLNIEKISIKDFVSINSISKLI